MASISIIFKNKIVAKHQISRGDTLLIGRNKVNDIVINSPLVSNQHAKIDSDGKGYHYVDLQSLNGSFKDGQMIKSLWLNDGDSITIGNYMLKFLNPKIIKQQKKPPSIIDKTTKIDTKKFRELIRSKKSKGKQDHKAKRANVTKRRKPVAELFYLSGNKTRVQLNGNLIRIGKDPKSDVLVKGFGFGKTTATINKTTDGWYINYVGGFLKPRVNKITIKKPIKLNNFDIITIGSARFQFLLGYR